MNHEEQDIQQGHGQPGAPQRLAVDPIRYLQGIPVFGGDQNEVLSFIDAVEAILPFVRGYDQSSNRLVIQTIKNKFTGKAKMVLEGYPYAASWEEIRGILSVHFQEDKTSERLMDEMRSLQFRGNIDGFYHELLRFKRRIMVQNSKDPVRNHYELAMGLAVDRLALEVFLDRMPPMIGIILEARNPSTVEEAMRVLKQSRVNLQDVAGITNKPGPSGPRTNNRPHYGQPPANQPHYQGPRQHQFQARPNFNNGNNFHTQQYHPRPFNNNHPRYPPSAGQQQPSFQPSQNNNPKPMEINTLNQQGFCENASTRQFPI